MPHGIMPDSARQEESATTYGLINISKIYGGTLLAANQGTALPDHWRFDAFAEYKLNKNWTTKVFVNNIFNKTYYDAFYQSAAPFVLIAPGRAAYWKLEAKF
jgi:catecholate siderophore receptor